MLAGGLYSVAELLGPGALLPHDAAPLQGLQHLFRLTAPGWRGEFVLLSFGDISTLQVTKALVNILERVLVQRQGHRAGGAT